MRTRLAIRIHSLMERLFPERRLFLKSDQDTRFIRLRPETQFIAFSGAALVMGWTIIATAILLMDSIGADNYREQVRRDQINYQARLNELSAERDARAEESQAAQARFNTALKQISAMQSELLASETRRHELETGIEVIQSNLRETMADRARTREALVALQAAGAGGETDGHTHEVDAGSLSFMTSALTETASERDQIREEAQAALDDRADLELELQLIREQNDQVFRQLEEAMTISMSPLDKMFRSAGMPTDSLIEQIRRNYSGQGGPLTPIIFSTRGEEPSADEVRVNRLLKQMDKLNMYRMAAEKAPFAKPVHDAVRFTSGFGYRRDPKTGGRRMHKGLDFAGSHGTDIHTTADGVVSFAGWHSGYGRLVKIRHDFGIETWYAHNSRIRVKKGQRVSRGDHIADMGSTGRSTGTHLHYEIRVNGKPVNPMVYIKAAKDVFEEQNKRARRKADR